MAKKAIYKVDNGSSYDELWFKTSADQVFFTDGTTFQQKFDGGNLRGPQGIAGVAGEKGATFTPTVSTDGLLSWNNDKGLNNPTPINLKGTKGDKGDKGDQGVKGDTGFTWRPNVSSSGQLTWSQSSSTSGITSMNIKGDKGDQGVKGNDGFTWRPNVNESGQLTWSQSASGTAPTTMNIKGPQGPQGPRGLQGPAGVDATPHIFSTSEPSGHVTNRVWIHLAQ